MMAILENLILNKKFRELRKLVKKSIDRIINLEESHCQDQATKLLHLKYTSAHKTAGALLDFIVCSHTVNKL